MIGKQYGVSVEYEHLSNFFQDTLHVHVPSAEAYIEQLKALSSSAYTATNDIEEAMHHEWNVSLGKADE